MDTNNYNEVRNELVGEMRKLCESENGMPMCVALASYHYWCMQRDQNQTPVGERLTDEQTEQISHFCLLMGSRLDDIHKDFELLIEAKDKPGKFPDFYVNMVFGILSSFDIKEKKEDDDDEDKLWIDVDNRNIHRYLVSFIGLCIRCYHDGITTSAQLIDIMAEEDLDTPWHDCTNVQSTYRFVLDTYGIDSSDINQMQENMDIMAGEYDDKDRVGAERILKDLADIMPKILPSYCNSTLLGYSTEEEQTAFRTRIDEMLAHPHHKVQMIPFFTMGVIYLAMCPKCADISQRIATYESCTKLFNAWYAFAGAPLKEYYNTLPDQDQRIVRATFLSGLFYAITKNATDPDNFFIEQG